MRIGFLNNQIDNRGTGNALFDYAHYNEEILGNESVIFNLMKGPSDPLMMDRLKDRFGRIKLPNELFTSNQGLDVLYHIKSGNDDGVRAPTGVRYVVHSVFDNDPHGDRYAFVSDWMANRYRGVSVPHIVSLPTDTEDLRDSLGISKTDIVFGRYGGSDSFDIAFAWDSIRQALIVDSTVHFLFMNTDKPPDRFLSNHDRVIFLDATSDPRQKKLFINTCDAMLHARRRGETFGIAVGEFAISDKHILTFGDSPEQNHYFDTTPFFYKNRLELTMFLLDRDWLKEGMGYSVRYKEYAPEYVMKRFKRVFLD